MTKIDEFIFESEQSKLYVVEKKVSYMSVNNKPVWTYEYFFFLNKKSANTKSTEIKNSLKNIPSESQISIKEVKKGFFKWFTINRHKSITNGKEIDFYSLRGETFKINPATGLSVMIETQFDTETGFEIKNILENL